MAPVIPRRLNSAPHRLVRSVSTLRRALAGSTWEGIFATPLVYLNLPANLVLAVLLAEVLRVPPATYGWLVSLPFWCNVLQLPLGGFLFSRWRARDVFIVNIWINSAVWLAFAGVLFTAPGWLRQHPGLGAGSFLFAAGLSNAVMAVAWTTYVQSWVPAGVRAVYFSKRNRWGQLANLLFLLLAGVALLRPTAPVLSGIIGFSVFLRAASAVVAARNPALGDPPAGGGGWAGQWPALSSARPFLVMVLFGCLWGAVINAYGAFQPLFVLSVLGEKPHLASLPLALSVLFGALALPAWGRLIARYGARPVMFCALPLWVVITFGWAFLTPATRGLLYPAWAFSGAVSAGIVLAQLNLLMKLMPPAARSLAVGVNTAGSAIGTALGPILAGQILSFALGRGWSPESVYQVFFLVVPLAAVAPLLVLRRVAEPAAAPVEHVAGAFRNVRTLAGALGLGFLAQALFTPRGEGRRSEY